MNSLTLPELTENAGVIARADAGSSRGSPAPVLFAVPATDISVFGALSESVRAEVDERLGVMNFISRAKNPEAGMREAAIQFGLNRFTLRRWWFGFKNDGWRALVPCNKEGCKRDSLWTEKPQKSSPALSEAFKQWFIALAERNQRKTRPAWREFKKRWKAGAVIPCDDQGRCTDNEFNAQPRHTLPRGCSYNNLNSYCSDKFALTAMRHGLGRALAQHGPKVLTTRVGLWPMSHVMIDDLWHDNFVLYRGAPVRVLEFDAIEILSGCKIGWGTKPRFEREDGTMDGLKEKFVQMLLAQIFFQHGYAPRGTCIYAEHGTAAVPEWLEKLLFDRTGGLIRVRRGGITGREQAVKGIFPGRGGGNPRFKSALESLRNLIHNELAALPGQTGHDRDEPEALRGELRYNNDLLKAIAFIAEKNPARAELIQLSLLEYHAHFLPLLTDVYETINRRDWHALEGWFKCGFVVPELNDGGAWKPADALVPAKREALLALARLDKGYSRTRQLSPREVFTRGAGTLTRIPAFVAAEILGRDFAREEKCADSYFNFADAELDPDPKGLFYESRILQPDGTERELPADTYLVTVNPFDLKQLFVADASGRHLGIAKQTQRTSKADDAGLQRQFGNNNKRLADLLKPIRERHAGITRAAARRDANNAEVIEAHNADLQSPAPAAPVEEFDHEARAARLAALQNPEP